LVDSTQLKRKESLAYVMCTSACTVNACHVEGLMAVVGLCAVAVAAAAAPSARANVPRKARSSSWCCAHLVVRTLKKAHYD